MAVQGNKDKMKMETERERLWVAHEKAETPRLDSSSYHTVAAFYSKQHHATDGAGHQSKCHSRSGGEHVGNGHGSRSRLRPGNCDGSRRETDQTCGILLQQLRRGILTMQAWSLPREPKQVE